MFHICGLTFFFFPVTNFVLSCFFLVFPFIWGRGINSEGYGIMSDSVTMEAEDLFFLNYVNVRFGCKQKKK